jgi:hypothetical protein
MTVDFPMPEVPPVTTATRGWDENSATLQDLTISRETIVYVSYGTMKKNIDALAGIWRDAQPMRLGRIDETSK